MQQEIILLRASLMNERECCARIAEQFAAKVGLQYGCAHAIANEIRSGSAAPCGEVFVTIPPELRDKMPFVVERTLHGDFTSGPPPSSAISGSEGGANDAPLSCEEDGE